MMKMYDKVFSEQELRTILSEVRKVAKAGRYNSSEEKLLAAESMTLLAVELGIVTKRDSYLC